MQNIKSYYQLINEDNFNSGNVNIRQAGIEKFEYNKPYILAKTLFKIGESAINTNSEDFKMTLELLKPLKGEIIQITGGASEVGNDRGFDNKALAIQRGQNLLDALKSNGVDVSNYPKIIGVVVPGTAQKGEKADNAQFVSITRLQKGMEVNTTSAIDNATSKIPNLITKYEFKVDPNTSGSNTFTAEITYKGNMLDKQKIVDSIKKAVESNGGKLGYINPPIL